MTLLDVSTEFAQQRCLANAGMAYDTDKLRFRIGHQSSELFQMVFPVPERLFDVVEAATNYRSRVILCGEEFSRSFDIERQGPTRYNLVVYVKFRRGRD